MLPKGHVDLSTLQAAMVIKCATGPFKWSGFGVDGPGKCAVMHACLWYICEQAVFALPGGCVACTSKSSSNFVPVSCPAGADVECCYDCAPGNLRVSANRCSPPCDIAYAYTNGATGSCALCKAGTIQNTTSGKECVRCSALKAYGPNYHATSYGCVACSALSVVNAEATGCDPCDSGKTVLWVGDVETNMADCHLTAFYRDVRTHRGGAVRPMSSR